MKKTHIVITGPTAVGKTALAIQVAQHFSTAIISADSRQCFKELNIGVAKPSAEELILVPHHFISSHHITDTVNAAVFEQYALEKTADIFQANDVAVMVGGTGLYIKAFCEGIDQIAVGQLNIHVHSIACKYEDSVNEHHPRDACYLCVCQYVLLNVVNLAQVMLELRSKQHNLCAVKDEQQ